MMEKRYSTLRLVLCCAATGAAVLIVAAAVFFFLLGGKEGIVFLEKVNSVRQVVDYNYIGETDWDNAADLAASGMIDSIGDRWSYYMTAEEYKNYIDYSTNSTTGIGVSIETGDTENGFKIASVTENTPADLAGIVPEQFIVSVAGESVTGLAVADLRNIIKAQTGSYEIGLKNEDGTLVSVTLSNEVIYSNPVSYEMLEDSVGYIKISNFEEGAAKEAVTAIDDLLAQGAAGLVFDVRSNPGGRLTELIDLLDYILPEGDIFVSVDRGGGEKVYTSDADCIDCPMAVLINANSYSAAEFFAAALEEYDYAVTVGEASTGKARSQVTYVLGDGSAVHISTRNYLTPNRVNLAEEGGLVPEIEVVQDGENDLQLDAAIKSLS